MPASYTIPNWIKPPENLAQDMLGGIRAGAEISQQQAKLQQDAQLTMMEAQLKHQQYQRENMLELQKMEIQKAYQQQQISQRRQELEQQEQLNQVKIQEAAQTLQARKQFQADLAAGMDPVESAMKNFPGSQENMTGYAQMARYLQLKKSIVPPAHVEEIEGQKYLVRQKDQFSEPTYQRIPKAAEDTTTKRAYSAQVAALERKRSALEKAIEADAGGKRVYDDIAGGKKESDLKQSEGFYLKGYKDKLSALDAIDKDMDDIRDFLEGFTDTPPRIRSGRTTAAPPAADEEGPTVWSWDPRTGKPVYKSGRKPAASPGAATGDVDQLVPPIGAMPSGAQFGPQRGGPFGAQFPGAPPTMATARTDPAPRQVAMNEPGLGITDALLNAAIAPGGFLPDASSAPSGQSITNPGVTSLIAPPASMGFNPFSATSNDQNASMSPMVRQAIQDEIRRRAAIRQAALTNQGVPPMQPVYDYSVGRDSNPESYAPFDPETGRPRYLDEQ